jgi:TrmH family RNA methyltransferase
MRTVVSPDNEFVKLASALRQKKRRDETGLFVVEGLRFVQEAVTAAWRVDFAVVAAESYQEDLRIQLLAEELIRRGCSVLSVPESLYRKISDTQNPQGILAVVRQQENFPPDSMTTGSSLWVILDSLQDPGNVGTIIRTADAAGAAGVILTPECADLYGGKTTRATMGSLFHLPVIRMSVAECLSFCDQFHLALYVAGAEAAKVHAETDLSAPCAIVFGNEGAGVGAEFRKRAAATIKIPILGRAESLNVASAAAIILFEAARQKGWTLS